MIKQLRSINLEINKAITYKKEKKNVWQSPDTTMELGTGDCEDFAVLKQASLNAFGIESFVATGQTHRGEDHAVCIAPDVTYIKRIWLKKKEVTEDLVLDNNSNSIYSIPDSGFNEAVRYDLKQVELMCKTFGAK